MSAYTSSLNHHTNTPQPTADSVYSRALETIPGDRSKIMLLKTGKNRETRGTVIRDGTPRTLTEIIVSSAQSLGFNITVLDSKTEGRLEEQDSLSKIESNFDKTVQLFNASKFGSPTTAADIPEMDGKVKRTPEQREALATAFNAGVEIYNQSVATDFMTILRDYTYGSGGSSSSQTQHPGHSDPESPMLVEAAAAAVNISFGANSGEFKPVFLADGTTQAVSETGEPVFIDGKVEVRSFMDGLHRAALIKAVDPETGAVDAPKCFVLLSNALGHKGNYCPQSPAVLALHQPGSESMVLGWYAKECARYAQERYASDNTFRVYLVNRAKHTISGAHADAWLRNAYNKSLKTGEPMAITTTIDSSNRQLVRYDIDPATGVITRARDKVDLSAIESPYTQVTTDADGNEVTVPVIWDATDDALIELFKAEIKAQQTV